MPKLIVEKWQTNKPYSDLEPSKAWIRNLGVGTTRAMPKQKWKDKNTLMKTVNKTKFKSVRIINRHPTHLPKTLYDSVSTICCMNAGNDRQKSSDELPTLRRVSDSYYFDDAVSKLSDESDIDTVNSANESMDRWTPVTPSPSPQPPPPTANPYGIKFDDTPPSLPVSSTDTFAQIDEASYDLCPVDLIKVEEKPNFKSNIADDFLPFNVSLCEQINSDTDSYTTNQLSSIVCSVLARAQNSNQMSQALSFPAGAVMHPVYMREDDVSQLIQSGHVFFAEERLQYVQKPIGY